MCLACWKFATFQRFDYFCGSLFTIHGAHSRKKKCNLFLTKIVLLATVIFWISAFSLAVSCKVFLLLPHQRPTSSSMPQLHPQTLKFYIYHQPSKFMQSIWYTNSLEQPLFRQTHQQPLFSSFIRTNPYQWFSWLQEKINHKVDTATMREKCRC